MFKAFRACCLSLSFVNSTQAMGQDWLSVNGGETITIETTQNILMRASQPKGSILLLTGGDGRLNVSADARFSDGATNVLIRNRDAFRDKGFNVLLVELGTNLTAATDFMAGLKRPVTIVATSKGTQRAAEGLRQGARPDKLVLTSGFLSKESGPTKSVAAILGKSALLPTTLVIHHPEDNCRFTKPVGVAPFREWAGASAEVKWLSGGSEQGNPCTFSAHHGFAGQDAELVALIADFADQ
ncbi:alpha/beta hydrolase (plasmid) [Rhizobium sp. CB3171]|uniref:alpha/beta hydrolase n=1 Tax=Rhizobium sp. CB3171 TaxID=3039157 RepID=UPI0024B1DFC6|nr:alpha/beta hydrolase [Rhizobium sp. CB3171]WFU07163.1 alpha/beta hydrolase [Rhizobium sp. CB3171]